MRIQDCFFLDLYFLCRILIFIRFLIFLNPGIVHFHIILWYDVTLEFVRRSEDHILWFCWHWFMWFWYYRYFECQSSVLIDQMKVMKLESYNLGFKKQGNNNFSGAVSETKNIFILWYSNFRKYFNKKNNAILFFFLWCLFYNTKGKACRFINCTAAN